jgi:uncharacterized protein YndB with AHSA1/START domain
MPSGAAPVSSVWRAISSLRFFRRLLGMPEDQPALANAARAPVRFGHGTSDWDGPDTSLTQAELEVLK